MAIGIWTVRFMCIGTTLPIHKQNQRGPLAYCLGIVTTFTALGYDAGFSRTSRLPLIQLHKAALDCD